MSGCKFGSVHLTERDCRCKFGYGQQIVKSKSRYIGDTDITEMMS